VEELIDSKIVLSMRAIYQSKIGLRLMDQGKQTIRPLPNKRTHFCMLYWFSWFRGKGDSAETFWEAGEENELSWIRTKNTTLSRVL